MWRKCSCQILPFCCSFAMDCDASWELKYEKLSLIIFQFMRVCDFGKRFWFCCAVPVQLRSEEVWTTAVEGTGKEGLWRKRRNMVPSHPKPSQGAINHTRDVFALRHWYTHINWQSVMTELTTSGCFDLLDCKMSCHGRKQKFAADDWLAVKQPMFWLTPELFLHIRCD